eukprot:scaffold48772_cov71-Phaeocystis_antarctica.AAC.2
MLTHRTGVELEMPSDRPTRSLLIAAVLLPLTLPIINHQVTDACGFRPALSAGWQGTRPCACDASKHVLNCDLTRPKAIAEAAALQGFDV